MDYSTTKVSDMSDDLRGHKPTQRQSQMLDIMRRHQIEHGSAMTIRAIGASMGIGSANGVFAHLKSLIRRGLVKKGVRGYMVCDVVDASVLLGEAAVILQSLVDHGGWDQIEVISLLEKAEKTLAVTSPAATPLTAGVTSDNGTAT